MLRKLLVVLIAFFSVSGLFAQSGTLKGKVFDKDTKEEIPFANIVVLKDGNQIAGTSSDFDGTYTIKPIPAGKFTIKCSFVGSNTLEQSGVIINAEKITFLDLAMTSSNQQIDEVEIIEYKVPLVSKDQTQSGETMTSDQIEKMPGRSAAAVTTSVAGVYSEDGEVGSIRGARSGGNVTFVDGVKVIGSTSLPQSAIAEVSVITGGLPAKYGDATGGIQNITTKGPSNQLFGGVEFLTSSLVDSYDYNLLGFSISGPLWSRTSKQYPDKKDVIMGYFISGELSLSNSSKLSLPLYRAKDTVVDYITNHPLMPATSGFGSVLTASYLRPENFETYNTTFGTSSYQINLSGKIDIKPAKNSSIVLGGSFVKSQGDNFSIYHAMFNSDNFSESFYNNWRVYARYTQKFADNPETKSLVKNVYYSIQADYEQVSGKSWDKRHQDNIFAYGHVGEFTTYKAPTYNTLGVDSVSGLTAYLMDAFQDTLVAFKEGTYNPALAKITQNYYDIYPESWAQRNFITIQSLGGYINGQDLSMLSVYNMWASPGLPSADYSISRNDQYRISAQGSADIGNHEISVGFEFEQRHSANYGTSGTSAYWTLARGLMNKHIQQLDFANPILHYLRDSQGNLVMNDFGEPVFNDTISYNRLYSAADQARFDIKFREFLNKPVDGLEWIDIDSYDPSKLSINYFSADELLNGGNSYIGYIGYDVYGNRISNKTSLQDFFTGTDADGYLLRHRAAYQPTYVAGYIQDKFSFKDLVFNVGVRVDRFDANQMVLKDPYSLYETYTVGDVKTGLNPHSLGSNSIPSTIGDDYVVYVDNINSPTAILGYRNNDNWYDASGTEIDDPTLIKTATGVQPYLVNPGVDMNSPDYEVSMTFEDYKPTITVMPRISFSFPISDVALFFAHYDILSTRPGGIAIDPTDYLFMNVRATNSNVLTNPNMQPEKTIDYELGFQQALGNSSALKLSAFYREMRNMQQAINIVGAYPVYRYLTYGNIDFGTVKGFSIQYDLRRTGNISLRTSYTLQFANGTGSSATEGINLLNSGMPNLRTLIPLAFDQRHALVANIDFHYGEGREYNGPKLWGKEILANAGFNLIVRSGSGSPYTKRTVVGGVIEGSVNGSRKPWRTTMDMTIDKSFNLTFGSDKDKQKVIPVNIYLEIFNVLNTKNILDVYSTTGNPDDNGYLAAAQNQPAIQSQIDEESYRMYYTYSLLNPGNYSAPRTMRVGIQISF